VRAQLGALGIVIAEALRERCFGDWEGSATSNYARVWATDETNPCCADGDVEPTTAVLDRATAFIVDLERRHSGRDILLVSHGGHAADPVGGLPTDEPVPAPKPSRA
jgi:broad specificity phosphatase PhoE